MLFLIGKNIEILKNSFVGLAVFGYQKLPRRLFRDLTSKNQDSNRLQQIIMVFD
jgi:hypothetical protein